MAQKIINTKIDDTLLFKYEVIKERLGIQNDAEVVRFLISAYFSEKIEEKQKSVAESYEKISPLIDRFMDEYGEEWSRLGE